MLRTDIYVAVAMLAMLASAFFVGTTIREHTVATHDLVGAIDCASDLALSREELQERCFLDIDRRRFRAVHAQSHIYD